MTTPASTLDLARELTVAMILDVAVCLHAINDSLGSAVKISGYGELLTRIRMAQALGRDLEADDLDRVAEIAVRWAEDDSAGELPEWCALAAKAQTFLAECYEAA